MQPSHRQSPWILSFQSALAASPESGLALVGGKGANLARLSQAGFPVPDGFLVTTHAYCEFVATGNLEARIQAALPAGPEADAASLENASASIRGLFAALPIPPAIAAEIGGWYRQMGSPPVAVRSSATAEDLPEMSFAGQQDTFLNVTGEEALLKAVVDCWSSLWTARAIGYRMRNSVAQEGMGLAVVVQRMVESQSSGVLFTANPLTGRRSETVIDATFGLGEALVSGQVEPDQYVVDPARGMILERTSGAKALSIHGQAGGGTVTVEETRKDRTALSDEQVLALAQLGSRVADFYGSPQDIEWAWADGQLYLLQSRAITSLFPIPPGMPPEPLKVMFSFGAVQGMLEPITPLGRDILKLAFAMGAGLWGIRVDHKTQTVLKEAGERLWVNVTTPFRNHLGRRVMRASLDMVEPTIRQAMNTLWDEPQLQPGSKGMSMRARMQMLHFIPRLAGNIILNLLSPDRRRIYIVKYGEETLQILRESIAAVSGDPHERLTKITALLPSLAEERLPRTLILFVSAVASGMASFNFVRMLSKGAGKSPAQPLWSDLVLELTRALPNNPTTEMDLDLWDVAQVIRSDPASMEEFERFDARSLADRYRSGEMPQAAREGVGQFLRRFGERGLGEIDLGRKRWNEDPTHVFDVLCSYIHIDRPEQAPDVVFARGTGAAQNALERLSQEVRSAPGGWFKLRLLRFFAGRMRSLMGVRESPKFFAIRMFGLLRTALLETGEALVRTGDLQQPDDLFYLNMEEIQALAAQEPGDWLGLIASRREANRREALRRQVPRLLLSDGRAFYEGMAEVGASGNSLSGSPVSPGKAEGRVRVVLNPRESGLRPGEILVCPGTDPSWTPLFLTAAGLVMEVGGMMTHGAVVAREYGIPAIVGVDQATRRLKTGQLVRIDGSLGRIEVLEEGE